MGGGEESDGPGFRPLWLRVKARLVRRLIDGEWQPGQLIPSEAGLARDLGASQGTVRKALDAMAAEHLLVRRQGRGTFVAAPEESRILFQFFRLYPDSGARTFPEAHGVTLTAGTASNVEAEALDLAPGAPVWRIGRTRSFGAEPLLVETIALPAARFPGFEGVDPVPNNLYRLYSERWGITIGGATERLKAVAAGPAEALALGCGPGTPLLAVSRKARDLEGRPAEFRLSHCRTDRAHYRAELR